MDRNYITNIVDILIISGILVLNTSFSVSHKLAQDRKDNVLSNTSPNFYSELVKIYNYLTYSVILNILCFYFVLWLFWPLEFLLLFLLTYKFMENIVYGLIYINEINGLIRYWSETEDKTFFEETKMKHALDIMEVLLEALYVIVIVLNKGISVTNFCVTAYSGLITSSVISKAWKIYKGILEEKCMKAQMKKM